MMKQNQKGTKAVQKTKEEKVSVETTNSAKSNNKTLKGIIPSLFNNKDPENNLVFLYW
ncbi:MAG: hypothetical protein Q8L81_06205 [Bacteroidota bacterium]|nr:hypothetical protein [Bacteroidota bacterium]